jgi:hypothetical protein
MPFPFPNSVARSFQCRPEKPPRLSYKKKFSKLQAVFRLKIDENGGETELNRANVANPITHLLMFGGGKQLKSE